MCQRKSQLFPPLVGRTVDSATFFSEGGLALTLLATTRITCVQHCRSMFELENAKIERVYVSEIWKLANSLWCSVVTFYYVYVPVYVSRVPTPVPPFPFPFRFCSRSRRLHHPSQHRPFRDLSRLLVSSNRFPSCHLASGTFATAFSFSFHFSRLSVPVSIKTLRIVCIHRRRSTIHEAVGIVSKLYPGKRFTYNREPNYILNFPPYSLSLANLYTRVIVVYGRAAVFVVFKRNTLNREGAVNRIQVSSNRIVEIVWLFCK